MEDFIFHTSTKHQRVFSRSVEAALALHLTSICFALLLSGLLLHLSYLCLHRERILEL